MREFIGEIKEVPSWQRRLPLELNIRAYISRNGRNLLLDSHFHASTASKTLPLAATRLTERQIVSRSAIVVFVDDSSGDFC